MPMAASAKKAMATIALPVSSIVSKVRLLPARFNDLQCHLLCQVIVVYRRTGALGHEADEHSNFRRIDVHVTKLLEVRLYLA